MNITSILFAFFGGLAIFLFGMNFMSEGLKNIGGNTFRQIMQSLTKNRFRGLLVGLGITCLIQSSSATSVMLVGLVNAGLLTLAQSVSVVLGADIGTTMTAWIVSVMGKVNITRYALPIIAAGFLCNFIAKKKKTRMIGQALLGFGFLFMGLGIMSDGLKPLSESEQIKNIFATFGRNPLLGILAGMIVTMILQSSSVTIAIIQVMAFQGIIGLEAALPLLLGDNIGTTITAQLAAIGGTRNARGLAMANSLFKIFGTLLFVPLLLTGWYQSFVCWLMPGPLEPSNVMMHIAVAHSTFNIVNVLIFTLLLWPLLIKLAGMLSFGRQLDVERESKFLDPLLLKDPPLAMQQAILELVRMTEIAKGTVRDAQEAFFTKDLHKSQVVREKEDVLDQLQDNITNYLIRISEHDLDTRESKEYPILLHSVNDMEKIGDYAKNIANYAEIRISKKIELPEKTSAGIVTMFNKLYELFDTVILSLREKNSMVAQQAIALEDRIDEMKLECRMRYLSQLSQRKARPEAEMMIMDVATNIEKMGDHLVSIAKSVIKDLQWGRKTLQEIAEG
jgi:phosphate:Na+ symporter